MLCCACVPVTLFLCQMVVFLWPLSLAWPLITFINYIIKSVIAGHSDHLVSGLCFSVRVIVSSWPKHPFSHTKWTTEWQSPNHFHFPFWFWGLSLHNLATGVKQVTIVVWPLVPSTLNPWECGGLQVSKCGNGICLQTVRWG